MNPNRFPVKQAKLQESKKKAKRKQSNLVSLDLLRNQTPQPPVACGVPGVQAITARPQDMTKITEIMEKFG